MDLPHKTVREGEAAPQACDSMLKGCDIIGDLHYVVQRHTRHLFQLEQEEIGEGGLGALYLRR